MGTVASADRRGSESILQLRKHTSLFVWMYLISSLNDQFLDHDKRKLANWQCGKMPYTSGYVPMFTDQRGNT